MRDETTFDRHASLVERMAQTQGVDLEEAILRGALSEEDRTAAILSCTNCTQPGACQHWLAAQEAASKTGETPPEYCRNTPLFSDLKRGA